MRRALAALSVLVLCHVAQAQRVEVVFADNPGRQPSAGLVLGNDGNFYGTTKMGGALDYGTIFKMTPSGETTTLVSFNGINGRLPDQELAVGLDGNFYGTSRSGGGNDTGTVFKVTPTGILTTLVAFNGINGLNPMAALLTGSDGNFYGTTTAGGAYGYGTVFRVTPGGTLTTLVSLRSTAGRLPIGRLVEGSDGAYYGTTRDGGATNNGTVFKVTPGGIFTNLLSFDGSNGRWPLAGLTAGSDGFFYGTTSSGGSSNLHGTIYKVSAEGAITTLVNFNKNNGARPEAKLTFGNDGNLYGTTSEGGTAAPFGLGYGTVFSVTTAGVLTTLARFDSLNNGRSPRGRLVVGSDGNFYGTASDGGPSGRGTAFKVTPEGVLTRLSDFSSPNGASPDELATDTDGNIYGATTSGGAANAGTVFRFAPDGTFTTLANFGAPYGLSPRGALVIASNGDIYGTTSQGGASGNGTVFKITAGGVLSTLATFNSTNGASPSGGLVLGKDGNLYGTTYGGGAGGWGAVFKVTPAGALSTVFSFNGMNGAFPEGALIVDGDGNFYGTTSQGGADGRGTVFKLTPSGMLTSLASFDSTTGQFPQGRLLKGSDGNLYGTTSSDSSLGAGTVFKVSSNGMLTTLVMFNNNNGASPSSGLAEGTDGNFYGTTFSGGAGGLGTVFRMSQSGLLTTLHSFDGSRGANPHGTPVLARDGYLYGTADSMVIWRMSPDTATEAPTLLAPAADSATTSPVRVSFILPEAALPGSVKLAFGPTSLTLAASQQSAGQHAFTFDPANPAASPEIANGGPIADGTYAVSLSYADTAGHAAATVGVANLVIDTVPPILAVPEPITVEATGPDGAVVHYTASASDPGGSGIVSSSFAPPTGAVFPLGATTTYVRASDRAGNMSIESFYVLVQDTVAPLVTVPASFTVHATHPEGAYVSFTSTASDVVGVSWFSVTPASGSFFPTGATTVTATARDDSWNVGTGQFTVTVTPLTAAESWRYEHFTTAANVDAAADGADPDDDGTVNLLERALGTDPNDGHSGPSALEYEGTFAGGGTIVRHGQPRIVAERSSSGVEYRALFVRRSDHAISGLIYAAGFSADLVTWETAEATPVVLADDGEFQIVSVPFLQLSGGENSRFFRLQVTLEGD